MAVFNENIFLRGADRAEREGARNVNAMQNLSQMLLKQEMLKEAQANELRKEALAREQMAQKEAMTPQNIYTKAMTGGELTPQEKAAYDFNLAKSGKAFRDESGNVVTYGQLAPLPSSQAPQQFAQQPVTTPEVARGGQDPYMENLSPKGQVELEKLSLQESFEKRKEGRLKEAKNKVVKSQGEELIRVAKKLKSHKGLDSAVGFFQGRLPAMNQEAQNFRNMQDQVLGKVFLEARESLKGAGAVTDFEGLKGQQAMSRLNQTSDENEYKEALEDLTKVTENSIDRIEGREPRHDFSEEEAEFDRSQSDNSERPQVNLNDPKILRALDSGYTIEQIQERLMRGGR